MSGEDGRVDLADFLLARVSEDEEAARRILSPLGWGGVLSEMEALDPEEAHIARWDPARVLAECEAKRRIVAEHADINADWTPLFGDEPEDRPLSRCQTCTSDADPGYLSPFPCRTLRLLALPYADHPDYDETWRA